MADFNYHGKVIVLDLDDTLARERDYVRSGIRLATQWLAGQPGIPPTYSPEVARELMFSALGHRTNHYAPLEQYLESLGVSYEERMPAIVSMIRVHLPTGYGLFPDAARFLDRLRDKGIVTGLATDGRSATQRAKIQALGLERYIRPEDIIVSGESGHDKHDPDNFIGFVDRYPEASGFIYIGDNPEKDFHHPNLLGWETICRLDPEDQNIHHQHFDREESYLPARRIQSLDEIIL